MNLKDAIKQGPPKLTSTKRCMIHLWLDGMSEDDQADAWAILEDKAWRHVDISDLFSKNGCEGITGNQVGWFRNTGCKCESR